MTRAITDAEAPRAIETWTVPAKEEVKNRDIKQCPGKAAHEIERHQLALVEVVEEDLPEPPQPHHIENDMYKTLVGEHVSKRRPGLPCKCADGGRHSEKRYHCWSQGGISRQHANHLDNLNDEED
jgi:hypothetical protein